MSVSEWFKSVVFNGSVGGWIWITGLGATLIFIIWIIYGHVGPVTVPVHENRTIDHIQTISVLDDELKESIEMAAKATASYGCEFKIVDIGPADIYVSLDPSVSCNSDSDVVACTTTFKDGSKEIRFTRISPIIAEHELYHTHNLEHPFNPPTGHILAPSVERVGNDHRGVADACARSRNY